MRIISQGLEHCYGLTHDPMEASSSAGTAQVKSSDFRWGNEANFEILYTYEIELENMPSAYTITLPVSCSGGCRKHGTSPDKGTRIAENSENSSRPPCIPLTVIRLKSQCCKHRL